jgi:hypothetical protein
MATQNFHSTIGNRTTEVLPVTTSTGTPDAGKIPATGADGRLDETFLPIGIGADTKVILTSESLAAGDFVNLYDNSGTTNARKADASVANAGKLAHGFVLDAFAASTPATIYFRGPNTQLASLVGGTVYVLSHTTPGGVLPLASGTTTTGQILQTVGSATDANELEVNISLNPIVRA